MAAEQRVRAHVRGQPGRFERFLAVGEEAEAPPSSSSDDSKTDTNDKTKKNGDKKTPPETIDLTEQSILGQVNLNSQGHGSVNLDGVLWDIACDCTDNWKKQFSDIKESETDACKKPTRFEIERLSSEDDDTAGMLSPAELRDFVGTPSELFPYESVDELSMFDTDNMDTTKKGIFGPGGDVAQFILASSVYETIKGKELSPAEADKFLEDYLISTERKVSFHISEKGIQGLANELGISVEQLNLKNRNLESRILGKQCMGNGPCGVLSPRNVGHAELQRMMTNTGDYPGLDISLVQNLTMAIYETVLTPEKTGHDRIEFVQGTSTSEASAIVLVRVSDTCMFEGKTPLLSQGKKEMKGKQISVAFIHYDAVMRRDAELASFFAKKDDSIDEAQFRAQLQRKSQTALNAAALTYSKLMPIYELHIL